MLKRVAVGVLLMVLVVAAVGAGLITASRMRAPTVEQQAALELLVSPLPPPGSNAFPALLLMPYEVPASEVEALATSESERFNATPVGMGSFEMQVPYQLSAGGHAEPGNCNWREAGCLDKVARHRDVFAGRMVDQQALLQRIRGLSRHGHYRSLMDPRIDVVFPQFQALNAATTGHALQFVDGNVDAALSGVCGDVLTWRTLAPNADSLIASMTGVAIIEASTQLLAEMLETLPAEHPLPPVCTGAFAAPAPGELSLCSAMRGEARMARSYGDLTRAESSKAAPHRRVMQRVVFDQDKTDALMAENFAWPCTEDARELLAKDLRVVPPPTGARSRWRFECAGNAAGCILADIATPAYVDYPVRLQDAGMVLRTMGTLLWIRERRAAGDSRPVAELLAGQPPALASATRPIEVVEGSALRVARFGQHRGTTLQLPLPIAARDPNLADAR